MFQLAMYDIIAEDLKIINECPICLNKLLTRKFFVKTINPKSDLLVELINCNKCFHQFINPTLPQYKLNQLYSAKSEFVIPKNWDGSKNSFSIPEQFIIKNEIKNEIKPLKFLEIGIGNGYLFRYFKKIGYKCYGVEPNYRFFDKNVVNDISEVKENDFDIVVMIDVIEHLENPFEYIKNIYKLMKKSGRCYASFPNNQSFRASVFLKKWRMIRPFGHLHYFSQNSMKILFNKNGFRFKKVRISDLIRLKFDTIDINFKKIIIEIFQRILYPFQNKWGDQCIIQLYK